MKTSPWAACALLGLMTAAAAESGNAGDNGGDDARQYTYAWQFVDGDAMRPRGGTTQGAAVFLNTDTTEAWRRLIEPDISKQERDRRAILAMAGPYRVSFDFIETVGFTEGYTPREPYQSWATEYVYVVADEPEFVSLQHILVMFLEMPDGSVSDPMVVKHWRQDWRYEQRDINVFAGHSTWQQRRLRRGEAKGRWTQSVYQVDDSPRYQAAGTWRHHDNYSAWQSDETWRPLPRREFSVRSDYDVLVGTNRHTIYPSGWVQEEDNLKVVLDDAGEFAAGTSVLARESGLARYERIDDHDWSAGNEYWQRTAPFWAVVRDEWADTLATNDTVTLKARVDDRPLFAAMFALAEDTTVDAVFDADAARAEVRASLAQYLD